MFGLAARSFVCKITQPQQRGTGTNFPTKRTSNGLSDLEGLDFVAEKLSQSPGMRSQRTEGDRHKFSDKTNVEWFVIEKSPGRSFVINDGHVQWRCLGIGLLFKKNP